MLQIRTLCPELAKKASIELNEKPDTINEDVQALKVWISKCPHLRARTDDQFLVGFLRSCKYSLERAKEKLDMFYTIRTVLPDIIRNRSLTNPKINAILKMGAALVLPKTNGPDGPRIVIMRTGIFDPEIYTLEDLIRVNIMLSDIMMANDDNYIVAGSVQVVDLAQVTLGHFKQFNLSFVKRATLLFQEGSPIRQKGFHYINIPPLFERVFALAKTFLSEKLKSRIHVHGDGLESLYEHIPREILPEEYGGYAGPIDSLVENQHAIIKSHEHYLLDEDQYGVDENKRIGKSKYADDIFGLEGSFRRLEVD